jgi:hypothetical protein
MSRRDELLDKAVAGSLGQAEAAELRELIQKEDMDARMRALIALGIGAAAGATLPKLLEIDLFDELLEVKGQEGQEQPVEEQAGSPAVRGPPQQYGPSEYVPSPPKDMVEEELETAREATTTGQVGAQQMAQPQAMGERARRQRAVRRR